MRAAPAARTERAREDRIRPSAVSGGGAGPERVEANPTCAAGHDQVLGPEHGHDRGVARQAELDDRLPSAGEPSARRTSASRALPPSNDSRRTKDPTLTASSTRAVSRWGVETATSTPHSLVEHPLVLRVVHPGHDARHAELLLGQQRHHQVVLVVAGDRGHDVARLDVGRGERRRPRRRRPCDHVDADGLAGPSRLADDAGVVVDDRDLVPGLLQLAGDEAPDAARLRR